MYVCITYVLLYIYKCINVEAPQIVMRNCNIINASLNFIEALIGVK